MGPPPMGPPPMGPPPMGPPVYMPGAGASRSSSAPGIAVAGFICACAGIFLGFIYLILPIVGLILSAVGLSQAKKRRAPTGFATAGIWISSITLALYIIAGIIIFIVAVTSDSSTTTYDYNTYDMILPFVSFVF